MFKLSDDNLQLTSNAFPIRSRRFHIGNDGGWIIAYKEEAKRSFEALISTQRQNTIDFKNLQKSSQDVPQRKFLKNIHEVDELNRSVSKYDRTQLMDGFYLISLRIEFNKKMSLFKKMNLFCVEDPSDLITLNLSGKNLCFVKEDDMTMFDCVTNVNASENSFNFDMFKTFPTLKSLSLACNNIRTINLKNHETYSTLVDLDLSFNSLQPNDVAHLGLLKMLKKLLLSGNNLKYLPDAFSTAFVLTDTNGFKKVCDKFPCLEELHLDSNQLTEENSFSILATLKKLKRLFLNNNHIESIPYLKILGRDHVKQEFGKSHEKRMQLKTRKLHDLLMKNPHEAANFNSPMKSDPDLHKSHTFRNSFILEEDEDNQEQPLQDNQPSIDQNQALPFCELSYINLAHNRLIEEDDLISVASWPMLAEIILHDNPIVTKHVGYPALLKKFLIGRLGIKIQRTKTLGPLRVPLKLATIKHENRVVSSKVPKIPKVPVDEKILLALENKSKEISSSKPKTNEFSESFFMTQIDHDDEVTSNDHRESPQHKKEEENLNDLLNDIENEDQIKVPSTLDGCVKALRNVLEHPLVYRDPCIDLQKPQAPYEIKQKKAPKESIKKNKLKPTINEVKGILENLKTRTNVDEFKLSNALVNGSKRDKQLAERLLKRVQDQYNLVRFESLHLAKSPKIELSNILEIMKTIQIGSQDTH